MQRLLLMISVLAALSASCAVPKAPTPTPPPVATTAPGAITLPPRPRDIPIDGIDPCSLLTADQRAALNLDGEPGNSPGQTRLLGATSDCTILGFGTPNIAINIALAPGTGIERYTGGELTSVITPLVVEGFPAVLSRSTTLDDFCTVAIDVAPGQLIDLQFRDGGAQEPIPQPELCDRARGTATEVMRTLLAH